MRLRTLVNARRHMFGTRQRRVKRAASASITILQRRAPLAVSYYFFWAYFPIFYSILILNFFEKTHKVGLNNAACSLPSQPCKDTPNFACSTAGKCQCNWPNIWNTAFATCDSCAPNYILVGHTCGKYIFEHISCPLLMTIITNPDTFFS